MVTAAPKIKAEVKRAFAILGEIKRLYKDVRIAAWELGALLHAFQQIDPATERPFYELCGFETWSAFCAEPDTPSRTSCFKYLTLHRVYRLQFGIEPVGNVLECSIDKLVDAASLAISEQAVAEIILEASVLSEADWRVWLAERKHKEAISTSTGIIQIESAENLRRIGLNCGDVTNETAMLLIVKPYKNVFSRSLEDLARHTLKNARSGIVDAESVQFLEYWLSSLIGK